MDIFCIRGGTPLHGRIALHGAKNAALPLLAATLATGARCELLDCPDISDVTAACAILRHLGCAVEQHGGIVAVDAGSACRSDIPAELMRKMRAAVLFLGPLLARFGTAELSLPGGCVLGARPIDLHLRGLRRMGAEITLDGEHISARTDGLHGCTVALPLPSVGATENLDFIREGLEAAVPPLETAVAGFSELVLQVEHDLLEVLTEWNKMPTVAPYVKLDVSRYITLIGKVRQEGFSLTREQELRCANIPFDETEEELLELFFSFLRCFREGQPLSCPELPEGHAPTLPQLEQYCRKLDLYFSFSKAFGCPIDRDALYDKREDAAESINQILLYNLKNNIRFCARCGAALPLHQSGRLCQSCYRKISALRRPTRW